MPIRISLLILALVCAPLVVFCQPSAVKYDEFIVLLKSGERVEGRDGVVTSSKISGVTLTGSPMSYALAEVQTLHVSTGTKAGSMALLGGAVGLASSLLSIVEASASSAGVDSKKAVALTLGLTGGGLLVGAAIGATMKTWRTIELPDSTFMLSEATNPSNLKVNSLIKKGE